MVCLRFLETDITETDAQAQINQTSRLLVVFDCLNTTPPRLYLGKVRQRTPHSKVLPETNKFRTGVTGKKVTGVSIRGIILHADKIVFASATEYAERR